MPVTKTSPTTEGPEAYTQGLKQALSSPPGAVPDDSTKTSVTQDSGYGFNEKPSIKSKVEPRRFHLSRSSISSTAGVTSDYTRGVKVTPSVFIERKRNPELHNKDSGSSLRREVDPPPEIISISQGKYGNRESQQPSTNDQSRPPAPLRNVKLPFGEVVPWDADPATLAMQMQAYTMQEIGYNLTTSSPPEIPSKPTPTIRARQVSSFKTKAPALRHHERYPEHGGATGAKKSSNQDEIMTDAAGPDGDESEYVMDTYIRLPAEILEFEEQKSVGLLVLDSQPDIDEFYNDDSDSDSEIYDDEEDENGKSFQLTHSNSLPPQPRTIHQQIIPRMKLNQMMNTDAIFINIIVIAIPPITRSMMKMMSHTAMTSRNLNGDEDRGWPTILSVGARSMMLTMIEVFCCYPCQL
jgi:hypothetical protein